MTRIDPPGTYRPQFRLKWRGLVRLLDRCPRLKASLADLVRNALRRVFDPSLVTTERVVEYPFVFTNLPTHGRILDIGCCGSQLTVALASRGFSVVGLDVNPYAFRHPNLRVTQGDVMSLPLHAESFTAVVAVSVIEHIGIGHYGDPSQEGGDTLAVREIYRVLSPGGRAVVTVPFGRAQTDEFQRVYDSARLAALLAPFAEWTCEYARSTSGLWTPCSKAEAASVDWNGPHRAVVMIVAAKTTE